MLSTKHHNYDFAWSHLKYSSKMLNILPKYCLQNKIFLSGDKQAINVLIQQHGSIKWIFSAIFASPDYATRERLWEAFASVSHTHNYPWLVAGDFNQVATFDDKQGGSMIHANRILKLARWHRVCNLVDLGFSGPRFTWSYAWETGHRILERLDWAYFNTD